MQCTSPDGGRTGVRHAEPLAPPRLPNQKQMDTVCGRRPSRMRNACLCSTCKSGLAKAASFWRFPSSSLNACAGIRLVYIYGTSCPAVSANALRPGARSAGRTGASACLCQLQNLPRGLHACTASYDHGLLNGLELDGCGACPSARPRQRHGGGHWRASGRMLVKAIHPSQTEPTVPWHPRKCLTNSGRSFHLAGQCYCAYACFIQNREHARPLHESDRTHVLLRSIMFYMNLQRYFRSHFSWDHRLPYNQQEHHNGVLETDRRDSMCTKRRNALICTKTINGLPLKGKVYL